MTNVVADVSNPADNKSEPPAKSEDKQSPKEDPKPSVVVKNDPDEKPAPPPEYVAPAQFQQQDPQLQQHVQDPNHLSVFKHPSTESDLMGLGLMPTKTFSGISPGVTGERSETSHKIIFVDNLPSSLDEKGFVELFEPFGSISDVKFLRHKTGAETGYGFIEYETEEQGKMAISALNWKLLESRNIRVSRAKPPTKKVSVTNLYVENVPEEWSDEMLQEFFSKICEITQARVLVNRKNNESRGVGFVHCASYEEAQRAMDSINDPNSDLEPRLTVKFAKIPRAERKAERMQQLAKKKEEEDLALGITASGLSVASAQSCPLDGEEPMSKSKRRKLKNRAKRRKKKDRYNLERSADIARILNGMDGQGYGLGVGRAHTMPGQLAPVGEGLVPPDLDDDEPNWAEKLQRAEASTRGPGGPSKTQSMPPKRRKGRRKGEHHHHHHYYGPGPDWAGPGWDRRAPPRRGMPHQYHYGHPGRYGGSPHQPPHHGRFWGGPTPGYDDRMGSPDPGSFGWGGPGGPGGTPEYWAPGGSPRWGPRGYNAMASPRMEGFPGWRGGGGGNRGYGGGYGGRKGGRRGGKYDDDGPGMPSHALTAPVENGNVGAGYNDLVAPSFDMDDDDVPADDKPKGDKINFDKIRKQFEELDGLSNLNTKTQQFGGSRFQRDPEIPGGGNLKAPELGDEGSEPGPGKPRHRFSLTPLNSYGHGTPPLSPRDPRMWGPPPSDYFGPMPGYYMGDSVGLPPPWQRNQTRGHSNGPMMGGTGSQSRRDGRGGGDSADKRRGRHRHAVISQDNDKSPPKVFKDLEMELGEMHGATKPGEGITEVLPSPRPDASKVAAS